MPPTDDPVQPTPFDVAQPTPVTTAESSASKHEADRGTPTWVVPALGVLLALAVAVIVWLPASLEPDSSTPAAEDAAAGTATPPGTTRTDNSTAAATSPEPARGDAAPWSDAQAAKARREAQEVAAELLELQYMLEENGVQQWAPEPFTAAKELAAQGDNQYRERNYGEATELYEDSLTGLKALEQSMPEQLERLLGETREAIENREATVAEAALTVAAALSPQNPDIATLGARVALLPQLIPLLDKAQTAESGGDLAGAQTILEEANALDPQHQYTQGELDRVTGLASQEAFNRAMSEGYAALDEGRYDSARKAFSKAAQLQEGSAEAASALAEVTAAETAGRLTSLEQRGRNFERDEQWQKAVEVYQQASKVDASVLFAQEGLARSGPRADLDRRLQKVIEEPQRLSDLTVASQVEEMLARANQVTPSGPRLKDQLRQLETLLTQANSTVAVTLRSDSETEVTVYKVARLGRFVQRELTLRPGTYTAVGTRDGFRDVRKRFTIAHDSTPVAVTITCTEPI